MNEELMVIVPMSVIERIRAEVRLGPGTWIELDRCVEQAENGDVLPCDVRLPPGTTFTAGTKVNTLLMAIRMRSGRPEWRHFHVQSA